MMKDIKVALVKFVFPAGISTVERDVGSGVFRCYTLNALGSCNGDGYFLIQQDEENPNAVLLTPCAAFRQCVSGGKPEDLFSALKIEPVVRYPYVRGLAADWSVDPGRTYSFKVNKKGELLSQAEVTIWNVGKKPIIPGSLVEVSKTEHSNLFEAKVVTDGVGEFLLHEELIPVYLKAELKYVQVAPQAGNVRLAPANA